MGVRKRAVRWTSMDVDREKSSGQWWRHFSWLIYYSQKYLKKLKFWKIKKTSLFPHSFIIEKTAVWSTVDVERRTDSCFLCRQRPPFSSHPYFLWQGRVKKNLIWFICGELRHLLFFTKKYVPFNFLFPFFSTLSVPCKHNI